MITIKSTTNYKLFKRLKGNRLVTREHVLRISKTRKEMNQDILKQLLQARMVIVNAKMEVIDGQHNIQEAMLSKRPVYYTVIPNATIEEVKILNIDVLKWSWQNHLSSFIELGVKPYIQFKEFFDLYGFPFSITLILLLRPGNTMKRGADDHRNFKKGLFQIADLKQSHMVAKQINRLLEHADSTVRGSNYFYRAVFYILKQKTGLFEKLIEKSSGKEKIHRMSNTREYLVQFENIINKSHYGKPIRIY